MNPLETPVDDATFELAARIADATDTGMAGLPFAPTSWPLVNLQFAILLIAWIGLILLTGYWYFLGRGPA